MSKNEKNNCQNQSPESSKAPQRRQSRVVLVSLDQLREKELESSDDLGEQYDDWPSDQELDFNLDTVPESAYNAFGDEISPEGYQDGGDDENG